MNNEEREASIDEFKGNTGYYKYQVSLMDGKTRKPIDIIECRYKTHLLDYFNKFSIEDRKKVKKVLTKKSRGSIIKNVPRKTEKRSTLKSKQ